MAITLPPKPYPGPKQPINPKGPPTPKPTPEPKQTPTPTPKPKTTPKVNPTLVIERTPYPRWWRDAYAWNININEAGVWPIIPQTPGYRTYVATIVINVSGETDITFTFGRFPPTGIMNFGGDGEPRGMVIAMGESPAPCGEMGFVISSNGAGILVSGFIVYYYEKT